MWIGINIWTKIPVRRKMTGTSSRFKLFADASHSINKEKIGHLRIFNLSRSEMLYGRIL